MKSKNVRSLAIASLGLIVFVFIIVTANIYTESQVPFEFAGALLGAIVTAVITMTLLHGQTQAEESKERNVKVFEEKTQRYNEFLATLWKTWENRRITLEGLSELLEKFSRDIIIYTTETNSQKIISSLSKMSSHAGTLSPNEKARQEMQTEVFEIINVIAEELNLGGRINNSIRADLNVLEDKIRPFLEAKSLRSKLLQEVDAALSKNAPPLSFSKAYYTEWAGNIYLCVAIENSNVDLMVGPVENRTGTGGILLGLFVDFYGHRAYQPYRDAAKGFRKDFLKGIRWDFDIVDFSSDKSISAWKTKTLNSDLGEENPGRSIGIEMLEFIKNWRFEGRDLYSIINECEPHASKS